MSSTPSLTEHLDLREASKTRLACFYAAACEELGPAMHARQEDSSYFLFTTCSLAANPIGACSRPRKRRWQRGGRRCLLQTSLRSQHLVVSLKLTHDMRFDSVNFVFRTMDYESIQPHERFAFPHADLRSPNCHFSVEVPSKCTVAQARSAESNNASTTISLRFPIRKKAHLSSAAATSRKRRAMFQEPAKSTQSSYRCLPSDTRDCSPRASSLSGGTAFLELGNSILLTREYAERRLVATKCTASVIRQNGRLAFGVWRRLNGVVECSEICLALMRRWPWIDVSPVKSLFALRIPVKGRLRKVQGGN